MSGRDPPRLDDPDDWFGDPGRSTPSRRRSRAPVGTGAGTHEEPPGADDWLEDEPAAGHLGGVIPSTHVSVRTVLVGAVIVVVLILAGLAIGGVFSGRKHPAANPTTATGPTTQARSTTPTTPARRVPTAPATTLKPGDQGVQVRRLQRVLARLGYSVGAADGVYGPATQAALTRFQKDNGLTADGVLGPRTLRALKQTLRTKS
jgi:hypothetical protein